MIEVVSAGTRDATIRSGGWTHHSLDDRAHRAHKDLPVEGLRLTPFVPLSSCTGVSAGPRTTAASQNEPSHSARSLCRLPRGSPDVRSCRDLARREQPCRRARGAPTIRRGRQTRRRPQRVPLVICSYVVRVKYRSGHIADSRDSHERVRKELRSLLRVVRVDALARTDFRKRVGSPAQVVCRPAELAHLRLLVFLIHGRGRLASGSSVAR